MALKNPRSYKKRNLKESITMKEYNKKMDRILDSSLPVHEKLIETMNEASKYHIVDANEKV